MATSKKQKPAAKPFDPVQNPHRVWIELERPKGLDKAEREANAARICELANNMLQRLSPGTEYKFWWSDEKAMYAYGHVSFRYLADNGEWLNLNYVGRSLGDTTGELWNANPT